MNPREIPFPERRVERFHDQEPYLDLGNLNTTEYYVLTGVTTYLHEAGLADIQVEEIPSIDDEKTYSLRWSRDAAGKGTKETQLGVLFAGMYLAAGAFENTTFRGDQLVYQASLEENCRMQIDAFVKEPAVFPLFTVALADEHTLGESGEIEASGHALGDLIDSLKITSGDGETEDQHETIGYALQDFPSVAIFLTDVHTVYKGVSRVLVASDSDIAHEKFFDNAEARLRGLLRPGVSVAELETARDVYIDPLLDLAGEGGELQSDYARAYLMELYRKFWHPFNGEFEGALPEAKPFRQFVYEGKRDILTLFSSGNGIDYYHELGDFFELRGLTGEGRLILLKILDSLEGPFDSRRHAILNGFVEECFRYDENFTETVWDYVTTKSKGTDGVEVHLPNGVIEGMIRKMQRIQNELHEEEIKQEVMKTNALHTEQLLECLSYYTPEKNDHSRRFIDTLKRRGDIPPEVRAVAEQMRQKRKPEIA